MGTYFGAPLYESLDRAENSGSAVYAYFQPKKGNPNQITMKVTGKGLNPVDETQVRSFVRAGIAREDLNRKNWNADLPGIFERAVKQTKAGHAAYGSKSKEKKKAGKKAVRNLSETPPPSIQEVNVRRASLKRPTPDQMKNVARKLATQHKAPVPIVFDDTVVAVAPWSGEVQSQNRPRDYYRPRLYTLTAVLKAAKAGGDTQNAANANIARGALIMLRQDQVKAQAEHISKQMYEAEEKKLAGASTNIQKQLRNVFVPKSATNNRPVTTGADTLQTQFRNMFAARGYMKHEMLGVVGAQTEMSLTEQIVDMVRGGSQSGFNWCKFDSSPGSLVWRVTGQHPMEIHPLQPWQAIVFAMARMRERELAKNSRVKARLPGGLLAHHSTGSGKTLTLLSVLLAFWNNADVTIMPLAVRSNAADNNMKKLVTLARRHFPYFHNTAFKDLPEFPFRSDVSKEISYMALAERLVRGYVRLAGENSRSWCKNANLPEDPTSRMNKFKKLENINESRLLYSYQILANDTMTGVFPSKIKHTVFLCDEMQYLVGAPASSEVSLAAGYAAARQALQNRDVPTCWAVGATATPGDNAGEFLRILSLLAGKTITEKNLKQAHGLISYANLLGSRSQFAPLLITNECVDVQSATHFWKWFALKALGIQPREGLETKFVMSEDLKKKILYSIGHPKNRKVPITTPANSTWSYNSLNPSKYLSRFRLIANFIRLETPSDESGSDKQFTPVLKTTVERVDSAGVRRTRPTTFVVGPKLMLLLKRIKEHPDRLHYVYATDMNTLFLLAALLERDLKMSLYREGAGKRKSFGFVDTNTSKQTTKAFTKYLNYTREQVSAVKERASADDNRSGKYVHVLLATKDSFKGVDVKNITHLHLLDAFADWQRLQQFLGRGPRMCSHAKFKMENAIVKVHVYKLTDKSAGIRDAYVFADSILWKEARERYDREWGHLEDTVRKVAVDSLVFEPFSSSVTRLGSEIADPCTGQLHTPSMRNLRAGNRRRTRDENNDENNMFSNGRVIKSAFNNNSNNSNNAAVQDLYSPINFNKNRSTRADQTAPARRELVNKLADGTLVNADLQNFIARHRKWRGGEGITPDEEEKLIRQHRRLSANPAYKNAIPPLRLNIKAQRNNKNFTKNASLLNAEEDEDNESAFNRNYVPVENTKNNGNTELINVRNARRELENIRNNSRDNREGTPGTPSQTTVSEVTAESDEMTNLRKKIKEASKSLRAAEKTSAAETKIMTTKMAANILAAQKYNNAALQRWLKSGAGDKPQANKQKTATTNKWTNNMATFELKTAAAVKIKRNAYNALTGQLKNLEMQVKLEKDAAAAQKKAAKNAAAAALLLREAERKAKKNADNRERAAKQLEREKRKAAKTMEEEAKEQRRKNKKLETEKRKAAQNRMAALRVQKKNLLKKKTNKSLQFTNQNKTNLAAVTIALKSLQNEKIKAQKPKAPKIENNVKNVMQRMLSKF